MKKFTQKDRVLEDISYPKRKISLDKNLTSSLTNLYTEISTNFPLQLEEIDNSSIRNSLETNLGVSTPIDKMSDALRSTVTLLKTFDGNPLRLESFVNQINTFHTRYFNADPSQQEYVILAIKSKILGAAEDFLLTRPDLKTWDEIKNALQQKFSDPITRANLQQQLIFLSKTNESTQDYIQKLKSLVTKINTKICTEVMNAEARSILISQNELTATQNLLANISSELRTLLIVQNPQNLDSAIDIITNYEILTSQTTFKNNYLQNQNKPSNKPANQTFVNTQKPFNSFKPQNSYRPQNQFQKSQFRPQNHQQNAPNQRNHPKPQFPQPMSGVSTIKRNLTPPGPQPQQNRPEYRPYNHFQQTRKPNFSFQELTHLENEFNDDYYQPEFDNTYPNDDAYFETENLEDNQSTSMLPPEESLVDQLENFHLQASDKTNHV